MLKKSIKGFTLIELLAVIVILAIIMIIATPMIIKTIEDARKGSFKNSAHGIIQTAEYEYSRKIVKDITPSELTYIYEDGVEISKTSGHTLEFKGEKPKNGTVIINKEGEVALAIHDGTYCAEKGYNDKEVTISEKTVGDCTLSSEAPFSCGNDFLDTRDDNIYKTVQIGEQCWFAEDLRYDCSLEDGKDYNNIGSGNSWSGTNNCGNQGTGYNGLLYQWPVAMNGSTTQGSRGLCPDGWHIPTDEEWKILEGTVDSTYGVGHTVWDGSGWHGNDVGIKLKGNPFNAKFAGFRYPAGSLDYVGSDGFWWASSTSGSLAWNHRLNSISADIGRSANLQSDGSSVRCILG